ncbi:MAG TPA: hypothetical protein VJI46_05920 [Candidatus Nanoarchaeia archaeon]|nr:hypothetical protein [Candidatus Nanoarchaeia archaeon]
MPQKPNGNGETIFLDPIPVDPSKIKSKVITPTGLELSLTDNGKEVTADLCLRHKKGEFYARLESWLVTGAAEKDYFGLLERFREGKYEISVHDGKIEVEFIPPLPFSPEYYL